MCTTYVAMTTVITRDNPQSVCEGLMNVVDRSQVRQDISCLVSSCDRVVCNSNGIQQFLNLLPCNSQSLFVVITDKDRSPLLNTTLQPMPLPQILNYTTPTGEQFLNISLQFHSHNQANYYVLSLQSSLGLNFPPTAIPQSSIACSGNKVVTEFCRVFALWSTEALSSLLTTVSLLQTFCKTLYL